MRVVGFICVVAACCSLLACDKKEGCLDPNATNYTIDAESNCCCNYPTLIAQIGYKNADENLVLNDTFQNDLGVDIAISNFAILMSAFTLTSQSGYSAQVSDRLDLGSSVALDDVILVKRNDFSFSIGTINERQTFDMINFQIGLSAELNSIDPVEFDLSSSHPLEIQEDSLFQGTGNGYHFIKLEAMIQDSSYTFTYQDRIPFSLSVIIVPELGESIVLPIKIQFDEWFEGIGPDLREEAIRVKILENLANSIYLDN